MNRILVINVNWIGDVIFSSPVFAALKRSYPQAEVSCLAVPRVKEVLDCIPSIDQVLIYDERGSDRTPWAKWALIQRLRQKRFDAVFILHRSLTRALLAALAGIPRRFGYDEKGRGFLLTDPVAPVPCPIHRSDHYLRVVESAGIRVDDRTCALRPPSAAVHAVQSLLSAGSIRPGEPFIVVNPGGNWDLKRWPEKNYVRLINALSCEFGYPIVLSGSPADVDLAERIAQGSTRRPVVLAGRTNLKELMALMQLSHFVVSADSGPLHLASSVGARGVGIFGPTRPEITGPRGKGNFKVLIKDVGCNRQPCYHLQCPDNICMRSISEHEIIDALRQIEG
jgi:heptosyltransferase II